jgi:hypothetical protein
MDEKAAFVYFLCAAATAICVVVALGNKGGGKTGSGPPGPAAECTPGPVAPGAGLCVTLPPGLWNNCFYGC